MPKVSEAMFVNFGLVGPKGSPVLQGYPMDNRLIFLYHYFYVITEGRTVRDNPSGVLKLLSFKL